MEKKYKLPEENSEDTKISEPAIVYRKEITDYPCSFTDEEKLQRIDRAIKDEEAGIYSNQEEIINKYKI